MKKNENYLDLMNRLYCYDPDYSLDQYSVRTVTFLVTDSCCCNCSYCYLLNKGSRMMTKETAKNIVDLLFRMYDENKGTFINKKTKALILEFIGGEPLMNIDIIDYTCTYFLDKCIKLDHPWAYTWKVSLITNGAKYFDPRFLKFLYKFKKHISFSVTIDGPQEMHDSCRVYPDGTGNFKDAYAALLHFRKNIYDDVGTKVTICPENLPYLNKIVKFFVDDGIKDINANTEFETEWTIDHAKLYYLLLKLLADYMLQVDDIYVSLFDDFVGKPLSDRDNSNYCGGNAEMLSFDPDGIAFPCIRFMETSLNGEAEPIIIGDMYGLCKTPEQLLNYNSLKAVTRRSQSTDECYYCPVASGCAWCTAWNYQHEGSFDKRCTHSCIMHKARTLANVYYQNKRFQKTGLGNPLRMFLPKEDALLIIDEDEYDMLLELSGGVPGNVEEYLNKISLENEK